MKRYVILNAVIWAAVLLLVSFLFRNSEVYKVVFPLVVLASVLQMNLTQNLLIKKQQNSCLKR